MKNKKLKEVKAFQTKLHNLEHEIRKLKSEFPKTWDQEALKDHPYVDSDDVEKWGRAFEKGSENISEFANHLFNTIDSYEREFGT